MEQNITLERPSQITKAVYLLYLSLGLVSIRALLDLSLPGGKFSEGVGVLVQVPLFALLYYMIGKGKNWARITLFVLTFLGILLFAVQSLQVPPVSRVLSVSKLGLDIAGMCLDLVALVLLFFPTSSDWFQAMSGLQRNPFKVILPMLRNTDQPVLSYVWRAWLIDIIPGFAILMLLMLALPNKLQSFGGSPEIQLLKMPPLKLVLYAVVLGPWMESCLMWPILGILKRIFRNTLLVAAASAVVWGVLHSTAFPVWGLGVAWPFFVFSMCFLAWSKISTGWAITVTSLVHMSHNAVPILLLVLPMLLGYQHPLQHADQATSARPKARVTVSGSKKTTSAQPSIPVNASKEAENLIRRAR